MNLIVIKGRLTRDPELKYIDVTTGQKALCNFSVAVDNQYNDGTTFFNCQAWGKTAETIDKFMSKGRMILLSGSMQSSTSEDSDGNKKTYWKINCERFEFCDSKKDFEKTSKDSEPLPEGFEEAGDEDDLPF